MDKTAPIADLISDAQELLSKLQDSHAPEARALRAKVEAGLAEAKRTVAGQVDDASDKLQAMTSSVVGYVRENPWIAVAGGTAIAVALLYIAFSGRDSDASTT